jgi:hypothetical protein
MHRRFACLGATIATGVASPALAQTPAAPPAPEPHAGKPNETELVPVLGKWSPKLLGFVEADFIFDTTQSLGEVSGNTALARPGTYAGEHHRMQFGVRNSRLGLKFASPEAGGVKTSALLEVDLLGNQATDATEAQTFNNPALRVRHAWLKLETPVVDVLFGQTWELLGWQPYFHPNTVEIQGVPGQVYSRTPQLRVSHVFKSDAINFEAAIAASRPPQRDSGFPDGQAGLRLLVNQWRGIHTTGATGTAEDAMAVGVSGALRRFAIRDFSATPSFEVTEAGWGLSADLFLPLIRAEMNDRGNALTLTGSYARGSGDADFYTALTGGIIFPALPNPGMVVPAPTYTPNIDNGLVVFDSSGALRTIEWQSFIVGLQYYLPPSGALWISGNYSHTNSPNIDELGANPNRVYRVANWFDANVFWDVTHAVRLGLEYAWTEQRYVDDVKAHNSRVQFSAFYMF